MNRHEYMNTNALEKKRRREFWKNYDFSKVELPKGVEEEILWVRKYRKDGGKTTAEMGRVLLENLFLRIGIKI